MRYGQYHAWTTTAMKYNVPLPELIAAALATRTTAEPWAIESLAKKIQMGTRTSYPPYGSSQSHGNLQEIVWDIDPHAAPVRDIYRAANALDYMPTYKTH